MNGQGCIFAPNYGREMYKNYMPLTVLATLAQVCVHGVAHATEFPKPFSQYGDIQNVQNYSSNPFWSPNAPYNQRMPQPVYVKGPALGEGECMAVAKSAVAYQCGMNNNCAGKQLSDVKPAILTQLSQMSGQNYVTACGGFVDTAFKEYISAQVNVPGTTAFPTAVIPGSNAPQPDFKIENPYAPVLPHWGTEEWKKDIIDRDAELKRLQAQNGGGTAQLAHADMPAVYSDLSFTERMANAQAGYEDWRCDPKTGKNCAYQNLKIETDEARLTREVAERQQRCLANPNLAECATYGQNSLNSTNKANDEMIRKIAEALKANKK